jgi:hypothetical protein
MKKEQSKQTIEFLLLLFEDMVWLKFIKNKDSRKFLLKRCHIVDRNNLNKNQPNILVKSTEELKDVILSKLLELSKSKNEKIQNNIKNLRMKIEKQSIDEFNPIPLIEFNEENFENLHRLFQRTPEITSAKVISAREVNKDLIDKYIVKKRFETIGKFASREGVDKKMLLNIIKSAKLQPSVEITEEIYRENNEILNSKNIEVLDLDNALNLIDDDEALLAIIEEDFSEFDIDIGELDEIDYLTNVLNFDPEEIANRSRRSEKNQINIITARLAEIPFLDRIYLKLNDNFNLSRNEITNFKEIKIAKEKELFEKIMNERSINDMGGLGEING